MNITSKMICGKYVEATVEVGNTVVATGLMDDSERADFVAELRRAADDIEGWRTTGYIPPTREADYDNLRESVLQLRMEVNCRIEHGADSGGHLEYVQSKLDEILGEKGQL